MQISTLRSWFIPGVLVGLALLAARHPRGAPAAARSTTPSVGSLTIRASASSLASDALLGRGTGTSGGHGAAAYLASECRRLGFEPLIAQGHEQWLPLTQATIVPSATRVRIARPGADTTFAP